MPGSAQCTPNFPLYKWNKRSGTMAKSSQQLISKYADRSSAYRGRKGIKEHERDIYACFCDNYDGASNIPDAELPIPRIIRITPTPRTVDKSVMPVVDKSGGGAPALVMAHVLKFEITCISR